MSVASTAEPVFETNSKGSDKPQEPPASERDNTLTLFREWLEERFEADQSHSYSRQRSNRRFAKCKDVDRYFIHNYEQFSTVLITHTKKRRSRESLVSHAKSFYPRQVTRRRRRLLKRLGVYEGMAGVSVLAPRGRGTSLETHAHSFLWLPAHVTEEDLAPLEEVDSFDIQISVRHHTSAAVTTPDSVDERGNGMDKHRGNTTALPQELGANLPMLTSVLHKAG